MKTKILALLILLGGMFTMGFTNPAASSSNNQIDDVQSYALNEVNEIRVDMVSESIRVFQTEAGSEVKFHYYGWSIPERHMVAENVNGKVNVRSEGLFNLGSLKLDIYLPSDFDTVISLHSTSGPITTDAFDVVDLRLDSTSGSIRADLITSKKVEITTTSGTIDIKGIDAEKALVKSQSGNLRVDRCDVDELEMKTTSGSIYVREASGDAEISTTSGKIEVSYDQYSENQVEIRNTSGSIELTLPSDAGFTLDAHTTSGRMQSEFQVNTMKSPGRNAAYGEVGSGKGEVTLSSISGRINLYKAN